MALSAGYTRTQIALHWASLAIIAWQFLGEDAMSDAWRAVRRGTDPGFSPLVAAHVFGGFLVLAFVLWRLMLRARRGKVAPPPGGNPVLERLAGAVHAGLYLLMAALPLSGAAAWFGGVELAAEAHEVLTSLLLTLIGLHVVGALYHQFWLKDGLIDRMKRPAP
ncbi:MAG: cytochrome b/b6 domain-containing protein [Paracoccaceae bacterium]